jgi:hypothetical protein
LQEDEAAPAAPKRRRRKWLRWLFLALIAGGLLSLNGPGLRWLAPRVADHFLGKAGFRGGFSLEGSLTGGISVKDLHLESDKALASLRIGSVTPVYRFRELIHGRLDAIHIAVLHADLRLGLEEETKPPEETAPLDLEALVKTIRDIRGKVLPTSLTLTEISFAATRKGGRVIEIAPSSIQHTAGGEAFDLKLGAITDATGREWPAQQTRIAWNADDLTIDRIDPLPGIGVRELVLRLPESGGPSAETELHVDDAVFMLGASPGFTSMRLDLREGRLPAAAVTERFGMKLPASAELTSLSINADGLLPDIKSATGEVRILLENLAYEDWRMPELSLDVDLQAESASVAASGNALGTAFSLNAWLPLTRDGGSISPGEISGRFNVADVPKLIASLADRVKAIDPAAPVPASQLDGDFKVSLKELSPSLADVDVTLKPAEPEIASALAVKARWQPEQPLSAQVSIDGIKAAAKYDLKTSGYDAKLDLADFSSVRLDRWLAIFKADTHGAIAVSGAWNGSGEVNAQQHRGNLALDHAGLTREGAPPIKATGGITYQWPGSVSVKELRLLSNDQIVSTDAELAGGFLSLTKLRWQHRDAEIASGTARLPLPEDFSKWRAMLTDDARAMNLALVSEKLPLALLKDWLPAAGKLDPRSIGRLDLKISGTCAKPQVNALLEVKELRSPEQPKLPPADLKFTIKAGEGRIAVDGGAKAPDFPAAVMTASMPFRPAEWAEKPDAILSEKISARVDLPRIDLSRFATLVPAARKLAGFVSGNVVVAGEAGKPEFKGRLDLTGGAFGFKEENRPDITGIGLAVDLTLQRIALTNLKATVAGGTLSGGGALTLADGKPSSIDFRVTGKQLPLLRNDSLILRSNADLRLSGPWERAALTGAVGVVDSLFYRDIELLPIGTPFNAPSAAALPKIDAPANPAASIPEPFRNWSVNVLARSENPVLIRGNIATGSVAVNLRVGGTIGSPAPNGEVKITDFRAALPFTTLQVRSGYLRFKPESGFDPILEIRGNAEPRPFRVNAYVYGRASNPQLALTSNPPLPDNEIMTLLATGTTTAELENPQAASSRAMQLLAEELRRGRFAVGKQLRPVLGLLDRVDFSLAEADPYSSESFSTATLSLTDRWFLSAGMGADGDSRVMGIWRFSFR